MTGELKTCSSCGAAIRWVLTNNGRRMPVDAATWQEGDERYLPERHISHFASCPNADKHRRAR